MSKKIRQKIEKIGIIKCILIMTLMLVFLCGCGSKVEDMSAKEEKIQVVEEIQNGNVEEENTEETGRGTEDMETEDIIDMKNAETIIEVSEITEVSNYISTLDLLAPHIIIWNEEEGYLVDIGASETYQLKNNDKIYLIMDPETVIGHASSIPELSILNTVENTVTVLGYLCIPDYSQFEKPQEVWYGIQLEGSNAEDMIWMNCYLYPPINN